MQRRVNPCENGSQETGYTQDQHEMGSSISNHVVVEVFPNAVSNPFHCKEEMLNASERFFSPILKSMKLFGIYFGETSPRKIVDGFLVRQRRVSISFFYCLLVMASLWFNFFMAVTSVFMNATSSPLLFFSLLAICFWSLTTALCGTICLVVLPLTGAENSRFEKFIRKLVETNADINKLRSSSIKILIAAGVLWFTSAFANTTTFVIFPWIIVGNNSPWSDWYGFNLFSLIVTVFPVGACWVLPVAFICVTCLVLERLFEDFCKRAKPSCHNSMDLTALKDEHRKLCATVDVASKMLSPFLFVLISFYIPLLCFTFYVAVHPESVKGNEVGKVSFVVGTIYWLLISGWTVAVVLVFGTRVNEKASKDNEFK